jgi:hypothetical protein
MAKVTVNTPQSIKVEVNKQQGGTVQSTGTGITKIKDARDFTMPVGAQTGQVITYNSVTNLFTISNVSANAITEIDAGFF